MLDGQNYQNAEANNTINNTIQQCTECLESISSGVVPAKIVKKVFCRKCWMKRLDLSFRKNAFEIVKATSDRRGQWRWRKGDEDSVSSPMTALVVHNWASLSTSLSLVTLAARGVVHWHEEEKQNKRLIFPFDRLLYLVILDGNWNSETFSSCEQIRMLTRVQSHLQFLREDLAIDISLLVTTLENLFVTATDELKLRQIISNDPGYQSSTLSSVIICQLSEFISLAKVEWKSHCFSKVFDNFKSDSSRSDFINIARQRVVTTMTRHLNDSCNAKIKRVMLAQDQTQLAIEMFSLMSLGRGLMVAQQMSLVTTLEQRQEESTEHEPVHFCRPLFNFSSQDLNYYLSAERYSEKMKSDLGSGNGLADECSRFVTSLEKDYPATVSTLGRIGTKLKLTGLESKKEDTEQHVKCQFCFSSFIPQCPPKSAQSAETPPFESFKISRLSFSLQSSFCRPCFNLFNDSKDYGDSFLDALALLK